MFKYKKGIISLLIILVLSLCSLPVAALDAPMNEYYDGVNTHEYDTEIAVNESKEKITQASVTGLECFFLGHDYIFNRQWRDGTLAYGSDSSNCYTIKERWIVEDKCTRCDATRTLVAPGAIMDYRAHTFFADQFIYMAGVLISYRLTCTYCSYSLIVYV